MTSHASPPTETDAKWLRGLADQVFSDHHSQLRTFQRLRAIADRIEQSPACTCTITVHERQENRACPVHFPRLSPEPRDSPLLPGEAFVAAFKREPTSPSDSAWMNGYAARQFPVEPSELHDVLAGRLRNAAQAYPLDMFSEVTHLEREWLHKDYPGLQDRIAASMGRHMSSLLLAAADALEQPSVTWQPIETAPKDGAPVILDYAVSQHPVVGWWVEEWSQWQAGNYHCDKRKPGPHRWMRLPAPLERPSTKVEPS